MKILVTGGAGFIGSHICDRCIELGHNVVVLDNLMTGLRRNINPKAVFYHNDLNDTEISNIFAREKFDTVIHEAAQMDVRRSVDDPVFDATNNILGFINILQNSAKYKVKKVIFASSGGAIYGEQENFPAHEQDRLAPCSPYGITKLTGEKYLHYYALEYGLQYIALRYANVYGPRQNPRGEAGVISIFTEMLLEGKQPIINGDGEQTRDFVFVDDVVQANIAALEYDKTGIFNVGTGRETTINRIFQLIRDAAGAKIEEKHGPAKGGEQLRSVIAYDSAAAELGWQPRVELEIGLQQTVDFFKNNPNFGCE